MQPIERIDPAAIRAAAARLAGRVVRTPLVRLAWETPGAVWLKLENLQPIGSFKLRGALNAMLLAGPERLADGVYTASAGNMAQGVAWAARAFGVPCRVVVPDTAPATKRAAIERLGGEIIAVPYERWWRVIQEHTYPGMQGLFIHPVADPAVIAGNGTIGIEIAEDLPEVDTVLVPYGGGGLSGGIAAALGATRGAARVYACEVETAAPLTASLAAGSPQRIERTPSFVDGIGGASVLPEMWPLARGLAGALVVSVAEIAHAVRLLVERQRVVAEGAGAAPVAVALAGKADGRNLVCVVSGGNVDTATLCTILNGGVP